MIDSLNSFSSVSLCKKILSNGVAIPLDTLLYSLINFLIVTICPVSKLIPKYSYTKSLWFLCNSIAKESRVYIVSLMRVPINKLFNDSISDVSRLKLTQRIISAICFTTCWKRKSF